MIIPTFTRLFVIRMVAKSSFGSASNCSIDSARRFLAFCRDFLLLGSSEKKATSEPDIKAEITSKPNKTKRDTAMPRVKG